MKTSKLIWMNGKLIPWEQATVHVMAHAIHYGSSVFEGIRCYDTPQGAVIFRLGAHIQRLLDSAKLYRYPMPYSKSEIEQACCDTIAENGLTNAYIRPILFMGSGTLGVVPHPDVPAEMVVAAIEWGAYLGEDGLKNGIDVCVSSWRRTTSASLPILAKAGGHYLNAQLIGGEARRNGFVEGLSITERGTVSEGSAENLFIVRDGEIFTPPLTSSILGGITRDSVITLARDLGYTVTETEIPRDLLYISDEVFLTGTAAEVTPVRSVDRIEVGRGTRGPVTERLQEKFFGLFDGSTPDDRTWLTAVK